jgi:hypothetical protein
MADSNPPVLDEGSSKRRYVSARNSMTSISAKIAADKSRRRKEVRPKLFESAAAQSYRAFGATVSGNPLVKQ